MGTAIFAAVSGLFNKAGISPWKAIGIGLVAVLLWMGYNFVDGLAEDNRKLAASNAALQQNVDAHVASEKKLSATITRMESEYQEAIDYQKRLNEKNAELAADVDLITVKYINKKEELDAYRGRLLNVGIKKPTAAERIADRALNVRMNEISTLTSR